MNDCWSCGGGFFYRSFSDKKRYCSYCGEEIIQESYKTLRHKDDVMEDNESIIIPTEMIEQLLYEIEIEKEMDLENGIEK